MKKTLAALMLLLVPAIVGAQSISYTENYYLPKPDAGYRGWSSAINSMISTLDLQLVSHRYTHATSGGVTDDEIVYIDENGQIAEAESDVTTHSYPAGVAHSCNAWECLVQSGGVVPSGTFSSLTTGSAYFLSETPGDLTLTPPVNPVLVGVAINDTQLAVGISHIPAYGSTRSTEVSTGTTLGDPSVLDWSVASVFADATSTDVFIQLPTCDEVSSGGRMTIYAIDGTGSITVSPASTATETIEGATSLDVIETGAAIELVCRGSASDWLIISGNQWASTTALRASKVRPVTGGLVFGNSSGTPKMTVDGSVGLASSVWLLADNITNAAGSGATGFSYGLTVGSGYKIVTEMVQLNERASPGAAPSGSVYVYRDSTTDDIEADFEYSLDQLIVAGP